MSLFCLYSSLLLSPIVVFRTSRLVLWPLYIFLIYFLCLIWIFDLLANVLVSLLSILSIIDLVYCFHVSYVSKWSPRYLTCFVCVMCVPFRRMFVGVCFRSVNVIWLHLLGFAFICLFVTLSNRFSFDIVCSCRRKKIKRSFELLNIKQQATELLIIIL